MSEESGDSAPWPPLPSSGFIRGREATLSACRSQYARWRGKAGVQRAILIQAERAGSTSAVGLKIIATGARVAATLPEVELLGTDPPQAAP